MKNIDKLKDKEWKADRNKVFFIIGVILVLLVIFVISAILSGLIGAVIGKTTFILLMLISIFSSKFLYNRLVSNVFTDKERALLNKERRKAETATNSEDDILSEEIDASNVESV